MSNYCSVREDRGADYREVNICLRRNTITTSSGHHPVTNLYQVLAENTNSNQTVTQSLTILYTINYS